MPLGQFLIWVVKYGAGVAAYFLVDKVPALVRLDPIPKRIAACAIAAAIAIVGFLAQLAMRYETAPVDVYAWIEMLWLIGTSAFGLATFIHTKDLKKEPAQPVAPHALLSS